MGLICLSQTKTGITVATVTLTELDKVTEGPEETEMQSALVQ